ncbi:PAS domain-containing protein cky-1 [Bacillus rossius redtenbacheri]|uniref:PAS domain-containing protein cky-1 n=1 Tax=Bacillus rossius redtenbacheri TaxID=93214 RepID=UPI002FDD777B
MFARFDAAKSTKGASKLRRDLINAEISNLRDLLPLPPSTRQRLSQLQLMALVCVYVRKANYFQQVFKRHELALHHVPTPNIGFSKALSGFLMMMTQNGKLLYISDNAAEYLGHSMEDLLIHGDSVYDIIDKQDHQAIQAELARGAATPGDDERLFLCRMNVSRNARRQMRFGDQKVVLVQGHYLSFLPLCSRNEPVFLATCTPVAMPETRECVVQGATHVFTSIHSMDMKFLHIDKNGEFHLGYPRAELQGASWYHLLHWDSMREAQSKHRLITQSEQDRSCILLLRLQRRTGEWLWAHCVLQVKDNMENSQQPVIVCTNQVLSEREAAVMRANSWLYHYYMVQSKLQYGLAYEAHAASRMAAAAAVYYQHPPPQQPAPPPPPVMSPYEPPPPHGYPQPPPHHHNGSQQHAGYHEYRYARRAEAEPVDYSLHSAAAHLPPPEEAGSPPPHHLHLHHNHRRKAAAGKADVLRQHLSPASSPSADGMADLERGGGGGGGTVLMAAGAAPRLRAAPKVAALDPEFMEQWNPSPPWSDSALQKVPDILHHDLSPYAVTTPPTPTPHAVFTFEWAAEQHVPLGRAPGAACADEEPCRLQHHALCWPPEHRLFPLQLPPPPRLEAELDAVPGQSPAAADVRETGGL